MDNTSKLCKKHGDLRNEDIQFEKITWITKEGEKKEGSQIRCRICRREKDMKWKHKNREKRIKYSSEWKKENKEHYREWCRQDRKNNPEKYKIWAKRCREKQGSVRNLNESLRRRNITIIEYEQMLIDQGNVCAICHQSETRRSRTGEIARLCIDHCHMTNKTRGLLCHSCNQLLGFSDDSIEKLHSAIDYLQDYS